MAQYAAIKIEFNQLPSAGDIVSFELNSDSGVTNYSEEARTSRLAPNFYEIGATPAITADNLQNALIADYANPVVVFFVDGNIVTIQNEEYNNASFAYSGDTTGLTITVVDEVQPDPQFSITGTTSQPPLTTPVCNNQRVKLSVENAVYPITINYADQSKVAVNDSELWVEVQRYIPPELFLTDDTGATDSIIPSSVATYFIQNVDVLESQSGATVTITPATSTSGNSLNLQYSLNGVDYQTSNVFTGILPGTYTAYIRDSFNCIKTQSFTIEGLETPRPEPNFTIEKANPLRFVDSATPEFRNVENTLFNNQENTNIEKYYFRQPWQSGSIVRTQIKTSYRDLVAKIYDECNNELTDEITPDKKITNIGQKDKRDCFLRGNAETGNFQIYFPQGNIYEPGTTDVINSYNSRGPLPNFASTGILVSVTGESEDLPSGTFEVIAIVYNEDIGYWTMEINAKFPLVPSSTYSAICESTYNAEIYDVFEFSFSKLTGQYRVEIEGTDQNSNYPDILHISEPIFFDELEKVVTLQYSSGDNQSGINYQTGIEFLLNIPGRLFNYSPGGEDESFTDDLGNKIIQKAVYVQQRELQTGLIPDWLAEKIVIASTHENFKINGLELTMLDRPEIESKSDNNNPLYILTCIYQLKNKIVRDEQVGIVSSSRAVIGADAGAVLGV